MTDPAIEAATRVSERHNWDGVMLAAADAGAREALAPIRALHKTSCHTNPEDRHCIECGWLSDWPCDTARLAYREDEL